MGKIKSVAITTNNMKGKKSGAVSIFIGALLIVIGGSSMLVEFFQVLSFGGRMFAWSLYPVIAFSLVGLFLILCGLIPPWREYMERKFFL